MKLFDALQAKIPLGDKGRLISGCIFGALFLAAAGILTASVMESAVIAAAVAAAFAALLAITKLYKNVFGNTAATYIFCAYTGASAAYKYLSSAITSFSSEALNSSVTAAVMFVIFFGLPAYLLGALMNKLGGELRKEAFGRSLLLCSALFFTVFLFLPSETFFANYAQLEYVYIDFAPHYIIKTLIWSITGAAVLSRLNEKPARIIADLLAGLLLCFYAQYMFMNNSLPSAVGDRVDWGSLTGVSVITGIIWLILLLLPVVTDKLTGSPEKCAKLRVGERLRFLVPLFIGGMQLLTLLTLVFTNFKALTEYEKEIPSGKEQFIVSPGKNTITFILDMADQNYFDEAQQLFPERFDVLKDFTCYTNTAMRYDSTDLSIPDMLSAARTFPGHSIDEWYEEIFSDEPAKEFYSRLHENNYTVNVFSNFMNDYYPTKELFDNITHVTKDQIKISKRVLYSSIDAMTDYRVFPMCLKQFTSPSPNFGNDSVKFTGMEYISKNRLFLESTDLKLAEDGKNRFIIQHLEGTHGYSSNDTNVEVSDCLDLLEKYFGQLKELGIYDSSLIIVTADHGAHLMPDDMPIFYMKRPNDTSESSKLCSSPIYLPDFAATCLDEMGLSKPGDDELFGRPISRIPEDEQRTRLVFQRYDFDYVGKAPWTNMTDSDHEGALLGYYFTGTKEDLVRHELSDPPDIVLETGGY